MRFIIVFSIVSVPAAVQRNKRHAHLFFNEDASVKLSFLNLMCNYYRARAIFTSYSSKDEITIYLPQEYETQAL